MTGTPIYDVLNITELTALQEVLYAATQQAYCMASPDQEDPGWPARFRPVHTEIARLFLEAGEELIDRLDGLDNAVTRASTEPDGQHVTAVRSSVS